MVNGEAQFDGVHGIVLNQVIPGRGTSQNIALQRKEYAAGHPYIMSYILNPERDYFIQATYTNAAGQVKERIFDVEVPECPQPPAQPEEA